MWFLSIHKILRLLCCTLSISSSRYLGIPPQTGEAYSTIGRIFVVCVNNPIAEGREDFVHWELPRELLHFVVCFANEVWLA